MFHLFVVVVSGEGLLQYASLELCATFKFDKKNITETDLTKRNNDR